MLTIDLKQMIRSVPDFPKPGINFFDITTLLKEPEGLKATIDSLAAPYAGACGGSNSQLSPAKCKRAAFLVASLDRSLKTKLK